MVGVKVPPPLYDNLEEELPTYDDVDARPGCCASFTRDPGAVSLFFTLLTILVFVDFFIFGFAQLNIYFLVGAFVILLGPWGSPWYMCWGVAKTHSINNINTVITSKYLLSMFMTNVWQFLGSDNDSTHAAEHHRTMMEQRPCISIQGECYHMVTKYRNVQRNGRTVRESYQEKKVTYRHTDTFTDFQTIDKSDSIPHLDNKVTRIKYLLDIKPYDIPSQEAVHNFSCRVDSKNRHRDRSYNIWMNTTLSGFQDKVLHVGESGKPWWMSRPVFVLFALFFLAWPYTVLFNISTGKIKLHVIKLYKVPQVNQQHKQHDPKATGYPQPSYQSYQNGKPTPPGAPEYGHNDYDKNSLDSPVPAYNPNLSPGPAPSAPSKMDEELPTFDQVANESKQGL